MSTRRSLAFSFLDRYIALLLSVLSSMVLARLLTPSQVGAFSVAMVLISLASTVRDLGVGQYLVMEKDLTRDRIRAVWAVQLSFGGLLALIFLLLSGALASFYGDPGLRELLWVLALNFLTTPFGSITYSWLVRELRFDSLAILRIGSSVAGAVVSVTLAWQGWGAISLAWGNVAATVATALIATAFRPKDYPWLPGLREWRHVLGTGSKITATALLNTAYAGAPDFLLGKLQGFAATGFFSRANGLVAMFDRLITDAVRTVALALFSKQRREHGSFGPAFATSVAYVTVLSGAFAVFVTLMAAPIVRLLYGPQWEASVHLVQILCATAALGSPIPMCIAALMAQDGAGQVMRLTAVQTTLGLALCAAGALHGTTALALCVSATSVVACLLWLRAACRATEVDTALMWRNLRAAVGVVAVTAVPPAVVTSLMDTSQTIPILPLALACAGSAVGFLWGVQRFNHPIQDEVQGIHQQLRRRLGAKA